MLNPEVEIKGPTIYKGRKYADAGKAYVETIRALTEVRLVGGETVIEGAWRWDRALRALSDVIAQPEDGEDIKQAVKECQEAEAEFVVAARDDLGDGL